MTASGGAWRGARWGRLVVAWMAAGTLGLALAGCAEDPCTELRAAQCAAAGETLCQAMEKAAAEAGEKTSEDRKRKCRRILDDPEALKANLAALKAAAALDALKAPAEAGDSKAEGDESEGDGAKP